MAAAAGATGGGVLVALAWTAWADHVKDANPFTRMLTSRALSAWNFGTTRQRLDPATWGHIGRRATDTVSGPWIVVLVAVALVVTARRRRPELLSLMAVPVAAVAVFVNLYAVHDYYLAAVFPAIAATLGVAIDAFGDRVRAFAPVRFSAGALTASAAGAALATAAVVTATWTSPLGEQYRHNLSTTPAMAAASVDLAALTPADARVVVVGCRWNPMLLYDAHRRGLMLDDAHPPVSEAQLVAGGYGYVFACDNDPGRLAKLPPGLVARRLSAFVYELYPEAAAGAGLVAIGPDPARTEGSLPLWLR